jgi:hypothetical protein
MTKMKSLSFLILLMLSFISLSAQRNVFVISSETELLWDMKTDKEISISQPVKRNFFIVHDNNVDSVFFIYEDKKVGYQIVPKSGRRNAEVSKVGFIADANKGKYLDITIKVRFVDWAINNDKDVLKDAKIMVNDCDREGNAIPDVSGLHVHIYKIDDIRLAK